MNTTASPPPAHFPALTAAEVHVWLAALPGEEENVSRFAGTLSPDERQRAERFRFAKDGAAYIASHGILRILLGRYLQTAPEKFSFLTGAHGKPELPAPAPLQFNLSHSGGLAAFAFTRMARVGVDVERMRNHLAEDGVAERFFAPNEVKHLRARPRPEQTAAFFACWTRKEAFVKARGEGLSLGLDRFEVSLDAPARLLSVEGDDAARWTLHDLQPGEGYAGAVAVEAPDCALRCWRWT